MPATAQTSSQYALLDSGQGMKLERFGPKILARPSSLAIWSRRKPPHLWKEAHATFDPQGNGWSWRKENFDSWTCDFAGTVLELRLQRNGQVGVFPDHASYLPDLETQIRRIRESRTGQLKALNLFAYTGLASVRMAAYGLQVCHVDLAKTALSWAGRNVELNRGPETAEVRLICDDARQFAKRERRRASRYNLILLDPPSFGRISRNKSWKLEDILHELLSDCLALLEPGAAALFLTCHHSALWAEVLGNILMDAAGDLEADVSSRGLFLKDESDRLLPAGHLAYLAI